LVENGHFSTSSIFGVPDRVTPVEFHQDNQNYKNRVPGLPYSVGYGDEWSCFDTILAFDKWRDGLLEVVAHTIAIEEVLTSERRHEGSMKGVPC